MDRLFHIDKKDVLGHYFWDVLFQVLLPERRTSERFQSLKKSIQQALQSDDSLLYKKPVEAEIMSLNGEHIFIQQTNFPIRIAGKRQHTAGVRRHQAAAAAERGDRLGMGSYGEGSVIELDDCAVVDLVRCAEQDGGAVIDLQAAGANRVDTRCLI